MSTDASTEWSDLTDAELIVAYEAAVRDYRKIREPLLKAFIRKGEDPKRNIYASDTIRLLTADQRRLMVALAIQLGKNGIVYRGLTGEWSKVADGKFTYHRAAVRPGDVPPDSGAVPGEAQRG